jgi:hypothetical protein
VFRKLIFDTGEYAFSTGKLAEDTNESHLNSGLQRILEYCILVWGAGIAQRYSARLWDEWSEFESRQGPGIFFFTTASIPALEPTQPPIQWKPGVFSLGVKRPGCEAELSSLSSAEVKNAWSYTSTSPQRLHGVVLRKAQGQIHVLRFHICMW